jgi:cytochrome c2
MKSLKLRRKSLARVVVVLAGCGLLLAALMWRFNIKQSRSNVFLTGDPHQGVRLFEQKGCVHCHSVNGWGGKLAPDLGLQRKPASGPSELVAGMWNCAPSMFESMQAERMTYPALSQWEMADLFAFLYTNRYMDEPGNERQGAHLFAAKGCSRCHGLRGEEGKIGPNLSMSGMETPILWAQAMWNHAPAMEEAMQKLGLQWPKLEGREMNDLLAYVRQLSGGVRREPQLLPADPTRGWELFQNKSCIACHAVRGEGGDLGPELTAWPDSHLTLVQFAGALWNHSPEMWRASRDRNVPRSTFEAQEMADLVAFLSSLRYFEPDGSPRTGESLFVERGCDRCHGKSADGTARGPALREHSKTYSLVSFATAVWNHGPKMYGRTRELEIPWPTLRESEVGDLLAFLNAPAK